MTRALDPDVRLSDLTYEEFDERVALLDEHCDRETSTVMVGLLHLQPSEVGGTSARELMRQANAYSERAVRDALAIRDYKLKRRAS